MTLRLYLMRHGETAWSISRQHIGRADNPPTKMVKIEHAKSVNASAPSLLNTF